MSNVFERMQSGEVVPFSDPQYIQIKESGIRTTELLIEYNVTSDPDQLRQLWGEMSGRPGSGGHQFIRRVAAVGNCQGILGSSNRGDPRGASSGHALQLRKTRPE